MAAIEFDAKGQHWYSTGIRNGFLCVHDYETEDTAKHNKRMLGVGKDKFSYNDKFGEDQYNTLARIHGLYRYPWSGLISVNVQTDGAENNAVYADDIKYLNLMSEENTKFTIEAYQSPDPFDMCDGTYNIINGLGFYEQPRKKFDFGFITQLSNEDGISDLTYGALKVPCEQLHIFYNCTAVPSDRQYASMNESPEAMTLSWDCSTEPIIGKWYSRTADKKTDFKSSHVVIDTRRFSGYEVARLYTQFKTRLFTATSFGFFHMPSVIWNVFNAYTMLTQPNPGANW